MTYREYTSSDIARASFFQNMVYETSAKQSRFRDIVMEVSEVTNEKIVFKVIGDGMDEFYPKYETPQDYQDKYHRCELDVW